MNEPLKTAIDAYEKAGWDFGADIANCLAVGEVQSNAEYFCMGWPMEGGGFFCRFLAGSMRACLEFNKGRYPSIHFARQLKHRSEQRFIAASTLERHGRHVAMAVRNQRR